MDARGGIGGGFRLLPLLMPAWIGFGGCGFRGRKTEKLLTAKSAKKCREGRKEQPAAGKLYRHRPEFLD